MSAATFRPMTFGVTRATLREGHNGVRYMVADTPLPAYAQRMTDRLLHWAQTEPDLTLFARRRKNADGSRGDWQHLSYGQAYASARRIAQALIDRGLNEQHPVVILSENDLEHALMALGCMMAGVPYCPASPAYSTISQDFDKLRHIMTTLTPGLVFAADAARYGKAIQAAVGHDVAVILNEGTIEGRASTSFADLLATADTAAVDAAMARL